MSEKNDKEISTYAAPYWSGLSFVVSSAVAYFAIPDTNTFLKTLLRWLGITVTGTVSAYATHQFVQLLQNAGYFAEYFRNFDARCTEWIRIQPAPAFPQGIVMNTPYQQHQPPSDWWTRQQQQQQNFWQQLNNNQRAWQDDFNRRKANHDAWHKSVMDYYTYRR